MKGKRPIDLDRVRATDAALAAVVEAHPELTNPEAQRRLTAWIDDEEQMRKLTEEERLTVALGIRLGLDDAARLDALTARVRVASRHAVARAALLIGLEALEADPSRLFAPEPPKPAAKPKPSKPKRVK